MNPKDFLKKQLKEKNNILFSAVNLKRAIEAKKRKDSYTWESINYKLYPSSIKSINMCPKKYIEESVHKPPDFPLPAIYKMEMGKIMHELLQDKALSFDPVVMEELLTDLAESYIQSVEAYVSLMYKRELKDLKTRLLYPRPRDLGEMLETKLLKAWPEVPGYDEESGFSFRADAVLDIDGYPAVNDIKTTSVDPDRWEEQKTKLPSTDHWLQVRLYRHFFNKHNYYPKPIKLVGLGYVNLLLAAGSQGSEHEVYKDHGEGPDEELELLINHLVEHRNAFLYDNVNKTRECTYARCTEHQNTRTQ